MYGWMDLELARERRRELLREADERRLALEVAHPVTEEPGGRGIEVRWGLAEDEAAVADLLQLNGMPRWVAFEERFIVAEKDWRLLGALRYATESKRLSLGLLVVDPWAGERRTARALYAGSRGLAREIGVSEIFAASVPQGDHPAGAGYRRAGRRWHSPVPRSDDQDAPVKRGWRAALGLWAAGSIPFHRAFRG